MVTTEGYRGAENKRVMLEVPSSGVTSPGFWNLFYNWWTIRTEMNWKLAYMLHWNPPLWYWEGTFIFRPFWHNFLGQFVSKIGKYCLGWLRLFSSCHIFLRERQFQSCEGTSRCGKIVQKIFKIVENSQLYSQYCVSTLCGKRAKLYLKVMHFWATLLLKIYEKLTSVRKKV